MRRLRRLMACVNRAHGETTCRALPRMLNYTDRVRQLMEDIVRRVPALSFIDMREVLVFARQGRTTAHGAYATCHSLTVPDSEPAYYFWRDRRTGRLTRRSEWFVMRTPHVQVGGTRVKSLISVTLPRFCDQTLRGSRKEDVYEDCENWVAKIDTIMHELYHIDPRDSGIRKGVRSDGRPAAVTHTAQFFRDVAAMVRQYLDSRPDPNTYEFLRHGFSTLAHQHGAVAATTFRAYPSFPQRYRETLGKQPRLPRAGHVVPLAVPRVQPAYTDADLEIRQFLPHATRRVIIGAIQPGARGTYPRLVSGIAAHRSSAP
jgi:hypothetical protein